MVSKQIKNVLLLLFVAVIWGFAFSAQRLGAITLAPFTLYAFRSYFSVLTLFIFFLYYKRKNKNKNIAYTIKMGIILGVIEFAAAIAQQVGIAYTSASNSSFITATYVIMVPIISMFFGEKTDKKIWLCVGLELVGLYLLCVKGDFAINKGDLLTILCAFLFAIHIVVIGRAKNADTILMVLIQFVVCAIISTIFMLIFELPVDYIGINNALIPILYTGILSSGLCVTIQAIVEKELDPSVASIIMCLEAVFGALGGWLILNEVLDIKELLGCAIAFGAIVISQLPTKKES